MEKTGPWSFVYFVVLIVFGNYILFNLLVAIIVEGFSEITDKQDESVSRIDFNQRKDSNKSKRQRPLKIDHKNKTLSLESSKDQIEKHKSFFIFSAENPLRKICIQIARKPSFENFILAVIFLNCITLAMESPTVKPDSWVRI